MKNHKTSILAASLVLCLIGLDSGQALARRTIANAWLAQYPDACQTLADAADDCSLCHQNGFDFNPYGQDVAQANQNFLAIEGDDSDGDGRTNGQEINEDCTLPGDSDSVPAALTTWSHIKALFR